MKEGYHFVGKRPTRYRCTECGHYFNQFSKKFGEDKCSKCGSVAIERWDKVGKFWAAEDSGGVPLAYKELPDGSRRGLVLKDGGFVLRTVRGGKVMASYTLTEENAAELFNEMDVLITRFGLWRRLGKPDRDSESWKKWAGAYADLGPEYYGSESGKCKECGADCDDIEDGLCCYCQGYRDPDYMCDKCAEAMEDRARDKAFEDWRKSQYEDFGATEYGAAVSSGPLTARILPHIKKLLKAKKTGDAGAVKKAEAEIHKIAGKKTIPSGFTAEEKKSPKKLSKVVSCISQVKEEGDDVNPYAVCRESVFGAPRRYPSFIFVHGVPNEPMGLPVKPVEGFVDPGGWVLAMGPRGGWRFVSPESPDRYRRMRDGLDSVWWKDQTDPTVIATINNVKERIRAARRENRAKREQRERERSQHFSADYGTTRISGHEAFEREREKFAKEDTEVLKHAFKIRHSFLKD